MYYMLRKTKKQKKTSCGFKSEALYSVSGLWFLHLEKELKIPYLQTPT